MQTVPLGSTVYVKPDGPDLTVIEHNRNGTIKLALFDGEGIITLTCRPTRW